MRKFIQQSGLVFALAAGLRIAAVSRGAELQTTSTLDQTNSLQQLSQQFLAVEQKLQTDMTAQDEELKALVAQMNSAPADQKLDAVVAVVNKLVEERLAARQWKQAFKTHLLQALIDAGNGTNGVPTNGVPTQGTNPPVQPNPPQSSQPVPPQNPAPIIPQQ